MAPRRRSLGEHGIVSARIRPGSDATVIDVSAGGALIETPHRLLPGAMVELQLAAGDERTAIRGRVVRCAVAWLGAAGVRYRGAIAFDRSLPWLAGANGYAVPTAETRQRRHGREDATHRVQ